MERDPGATIGATNSNLINIQRSPGDRSKSLGNQSTDYSSGVRTTPSQKEEGGFNDSTDCSPCACPTCTGKEEGGLMTLGERSAA